MNKYHYVIDRVRQRLRREIGLNKTSRDFFEQFFSSVSQNKKILNVSLSPGDFFVVLFEMYLDVLFSQEVEDFSVSGVLYADLMAVFFYECLRELDVDDVSRAVARFNAVFFDSLQMVIVDGFTDASRKQSQTYFVDNIIFMNSFDVKF